MRRSQNKIYYSLVVQINKNFIQCRPWESAYKRQNYYRLEKNPDIEKIRQETRSSYIYTLKYIL